jgi:alpha-galactosidase
MLRPGRWGRLVSLAAAGVLLLMAPFAAMRTPAAHALDNGVGRVPAMGWNTWNTFG